MAFGGATLAACPLSALVLSFAFYGFCGWAWESTVCAMLNHGRFANSGFLLGPCCPIYGADRHCLLAAVARDSGCLEPVCRCSTRMQRD
ncbi:MAG: hypothetical protein U0K38_09035 [Collinsella sp.]|nr:hypothetical protein [Collinsella sp.]